jgi:hypothetical protein
MEYEIPDEYLEEVAATAEHAMAIIEPHLPTIQGVFESVADASAAFGPVLAEAERSIRSYQNTERFRREAFIPLSFRAAERRGQPLIDYNLIADKVVERLKPQHAPQGRASYPLPKGANLAKLKFKQVDGHTVKVKYLGLPTGTFDYKDFGMENKKSHQPDAVWKCLCKLFETNRITGYNRGITRNTKYKLNACLKAFFETDEDFFYRYNFGNHEWVAKPMFVAESDQIPFESE